MTFNKIFLTVALIPFLILGCGKPDDNPDDKDNPGETTNPDNPGGDDSEDKPQTALPDFSTFKLGETFTVAYNGEELLPYKGLNAGDRIEAFITTGPEKGHTVNFEVTRTDEEKGAWISSPKGFIGGNCTLTLYRASGAKTSLGNTYVDAFDRFEVPKNPGFTVYGRVADADGNPIAGVTVSDGVFTTATAQDGTYYLLSMRKYGYVFISVPSGYRAATNASIPQFFRRITSATTQYEMKNFVLAPQENKRHRLVVFTDVHMANRTDDKIQFQRGFLKELESQWQQAAAEGVALYGMSLGDLTWDEWWYSNSMQPKDYCALMTEVDVPVYNITGNHDNDPYVADDFKSENAWRKAFGPTYYSFNIGDVHYVQLDNTLFSNAGGAQGTIGNVQDYKQGFTEDELSWLKADLANVPKDRKLVIGMHIPYTNRNKIGSDGNPTFSQAMPADMASKLLTLIDGYDVMILSGHTHIRFTNRISEKILEQNIGAICGTWWWTGKYSNYRTNMCRDGVPDGYEVIDFDGTSFTSYYKPVGKDRNYQFRCYDLNNCLIDRATYCPNVVNNFKNVTEAVFKQYACGYDTARKDNAVLINIFSWNPDYKIEVREVETGKSLEASRLETYDPLHVIHFNMGRMNSNSANLTFPTLLTAHMFMVSCSSATSTLQIKVTDEFGNEYTETMTRPRYLKDMSTSTQW